MVADVTNGGAAGISAAPAIELRGISKAFGPVQANKDINIRVRKGTIHGIIGVQRRDQVFHLDLTGACWQVIVQRTHARFFGLLDLGVHIDLAGGVITNQHNGKTRRHAMFRFQRLDLPGDGLPECFGNCLTVNPFTRHASLPKCCLTDRHCVDCNESEE